MNIIKYKKDKANKYKVTIDDNDYLIYDDVIIKYNLLLNKEISEDTFKEMISYNLELASYYECIKYITKKIRCRSEIEEYLKKKDVNKKIIDKTIKRLENDKYLNDDIFLKAYINDQINLTNNGPLKIKKNLIKYKIEESKIDDALNKIDSYIWLDKLEHYVNKKVKINHSNSLNVLKMKIKNDLYNLGYDNTMINDIISSIKFDDSNIYEREYEKAKRKLEKKYSGYELDMKIKEYMYRKGFRGNSYEE